MSDENISGGGEQAEGSESGALDAGRPAVAAAPARFALLLIVVVIFIAIVIRSLFFGSTPVAEKPKNAPKEVVDQEEKKTNTMNSVEEVANSLPVPPAPTPIAPPVSSGKSSSSDSRGIPVMATITPPTGDSSGGSGLNGNGFMPSTALPPPVKIEPPSPQFNAPVNPHDEEMKARMRSALVTYGGTSGSAGAKDDKKIDYNNIADSGLGSPKVVSQVKNLSNTIVQGKIINAVLETALNSDAPGQVRAIVSHDTYAESGRDVLIPKGSRLVGTYSANVKRGQARVSIIWTRMIRPDGVDIDIDSAAVDGLGRNGLEGDVDNKYFEMFSSAILTSAVDIGIAKVTDTLFPQTNSTSTSNTDGSTTTTTSPTTTAVQAAVSSVGAVGQSITSSVLNISPTITIDQGTVVNVYVNHDLVFPFGEKRRSDVVE